MGYDILILTDHSGHTSENSTYALASALAADPHINTVDIASRGLPDNTRFFKGDMEAIISVIPAIPRLTYKRALLLFESATTDAELTDYDFILLRLPPTVPVKLFRALIHTIPEDHIINEPSGIIRTASKSFLLELQDLCPPIQLVKKQSEVMALVKKSPIVLKPLYGYAGQDIVKVTNLHVENGHGQRTNHPTYFRNWSPPYLAMQFLPRVLDGDKRTIVVNGEIMGSAIRTPAPGSWMCNVAQGGSSIHAMADENERHIAQRLIQELGKYGIVMFGFDTLINNDGHRVLTELNTMSIGGLKQIRDKNNKPIMKKVVHQLVRHMDAVWYGNEEGEGNR